MLGLSLMTFREALEFPSHPEDRMRCCPLALDLIPQFIKWHARTQPIPRHGQHSCAEEVSILRQQIKSSHGASLRG